MHFLKTFRKSKNSRESRAHSKARKVDWYFFLINEIKESFGHLLPFVEGSEVKWPK